MKKTVKKALLTTFATVLVCSATTLVGANALKASAADDTTAAITEFTMLADPTIRATTAGNAADNGIRFTAEVNATQFEALDDNGATVTTGTFIMPYDYIYNVADATKLDKTHFFGETAVFTWEGKTEAYGATQILHVAATPVQGTDVYKINGSVVNMHEVNLDREYIGVAYIAVDDGTTTEYYLAETDEAANKRSALQVAQNVLLGSSTEIETTIATDYIETYIDWYKTETGAYPTRTLTTEYYVDSSEGYSKSNTLSKTEEIVLDEVADFTATYGSETPTLDGYTYAKGAMGNVTTTTLSVDNGGAVKYYFDKNRDNVIFDGATMTVGLNDDTTDVSVGGYYTSPTAMNGIMSSSEWGYHGSNSIHVSSTGGGWQYALDITLKEAKTFAPTNTFSMMIMVDYNNNIMQDINVQVTTADGTEYINDTYGDMVRGGNVGDVKEISFTLSQAISSIKKISFYMSGKTTEPFTDSSGNVVEADTWRGLQPFYVDYICAENPVYTTMSNIELEKDQTSVEIDIGNNVKTTTFSDDEWKNVELFVSYKALNGGSEVPVTLEDGKFTLQVVAETNYQVDYTATIGEKSVSNSIYVLAYYENLLTGFENDGSTTSTWLSVVSGNSIDGDYALATIDGRTTANNYPSSWAEYNMTDGVTLTKDCTTVSVWVYAPSDRTVEKLTSTGWLYVIGTKADGSSLATHLRADVDTVELKAGWNYVQYTMTNSYVLGLIKEGATITSIQVFTAVSASGVTYLQGLVFDRWALC